MKQLKVGDAVKFKQMDGDFFFVDPFREYEGQEEVNQFDYVGLVGVVEELDLANEPDDENPQHLVRFEDGVKASLALSELELLEEVR